MKIPVTELDIVFISYDEPNGDKNYLNFLWSPGELTPLVEIKKLLPGHILHGNINNISRIKIEKSSLI